ncbi:hypothetical protein [Bacillus wiedmannii]|uniref:hypothetical protein n=1 Tax=Bacillus wiedmannii TaxID=1890302 RepID=UPI000BF3E2A9|nr:hypothetical protein [Bacillus wiedmannii]PFZ64880.1 hypothetical protein COL76_13085 [Bacillus wiedmannii]
MDKLINHSYSKKEFCIIWGIDPTLSKSLLRSKLEKVHQHCKWHTEGKGAGVKYYIDELYDEAKEKLHGLTGKQSNNYGKRSKTSHSYRLALALITNFATDNECYVLTESNQYYLTQLGCKLHGLKHLHQMLSGTDYERLNGIARKLANNNHKALIGIFKDAIELIKEGTFPNVEIREQLYWANLDNEHFEFDESDEQVYELYDLYLEAKEEAESIIAEEYGRIMARSKWYYLVNNEYHELICEGRYRPLFDAGIDYIYIRYYFIKNGQETPGNEYYDYETLNYDGRFHDYDEEGRIEAEDFVIEFQKHRRECSLQQMESEIEKGILGIVDFDELRQFAQDFTMLLFDNNEYEEFVERFNELMENVRNIKSTGFCE